MCVQLSLIKVDTLMDFKMYVIYFNINVVRKDCLDIRCYERTKQFYFVVLVLVSLKSYIVFLLLFFLALFLFCKVATIGPLLCQIMTTNFLIYQA